MQSRQVKKNNSLRRGVSIVEFIGCIVALCGGVYLGSSYLGIDLEGVAADLMQESQSVAAASVEQATGDTDVSKGGDHVVSSSGTSDGSMQGATQAGESKLVVIELTEAEREAATLAYWKALTSCVREEALGRRSEGENSSSWQLLDQFKHRKNRHQQAADTIEQLDSNGVDEKVISHAKQFLDWHLTGAKLYQQGLNLIAAGPAAGFSSPPAKKWQSSVTQHHMEEKLIREKHFGVANYINHTYKSPEASR